MKHLYIIIIAALSMLSCKQELKDLGEYAYLGGEVISPIEDFVVLKKSEEVIDTVKLNENNRFLYKFKDLEAGLYSFNLKSSVGNEYQIVILEPKDSILFRINTKDFDESLVYTGVGSKKNNYLINMFLSCEAEEHKIYKLSKFPAVEFEHKLDSMTNNKREKLRRFKEKYGFDDTSLFSKVAQANIDFNYNSSKELYPFIYFGYNKLKSIESLPQDFYSFRKNINYNDDLLKDYFSYNRFLEYHFNNLALNEYFKQSEHCKFNRKALSYNLAKLNLIDSLVSHKEIKNRLLYYNVASFLNKNGNYEQCDSVLASYLEKSTDDVKKEKVIAYSKSLKGLRNGYDFPDITLINNNAEVISFNDFVKKPTVVYFWNSGYKWHFKETYKKVKKLKHKYPNINFIAINVNDNDIEQWKGIMERYNLSTKGQYKFKDIEKGKKALALYEINKVFILDKKSKIVNANGNLLDSGFEKQLASLKP